MDLHDPLKQALGRAQDHVARGETAKAAVAYEKAASLMSLYAEQAIGRDAELRRKKKVVEDREWARRLRAGEVTPAPRARPGGGALPARFP
ncbi:MAG: hypothetical protein HZA54_18835, partial [Planctomycetes bacterium]|nr:hypothetical protein [Planctomycetota bacterium]